MSKKGWNCFVDLVSMKRLFEIFCPRNSYTLNPVENLIACRRNFIIAMLTFTPASLTAFRNYLNVSLLCLFNARFKEHLVGAKWKFVVSLEKKKLSWKKIVFLSINGWKRPTKWVNECKEKFLKILIIAAGFSHEVKLKLKIYHVKLNEIPAITIKKNYNRFSRKNF